MPSNARAHSLYLTSILVDAGVVTNEQVAAGLERQRTSGLRIGETLVEMGAATEEDIGWALARQLGLPFVDPRPEALDLDLIRSFPVGLLRRHDALPLVREDRVVVVVLADPTDYGALDELEVAAGRPLRVAVGTSTAIRRTLALVLGSRVEAGTPPEHATLMASEAPDGRPGADLLAREVERAITARASEIHFLPGPGSLDVFHRTAGRLVHSAGESRDALNALLDRIEALGGPVPGSAARHAAGRLRFPTGLGMITLEVSIVRQRSGLAVTLAFGGPTAGPNALEDLGLEPVDLARLRAALDAPAGLGIVTGPPRSGGSTTLACLVNELGARPVRCLAFGAVSSLVRPEACVECDQAEALGAWPEVVVSQRADVAALDGVLCGDALAAALSPAASGRWVIVRTDWTDSFAMLEQLATHPAGRAALVDRLRFVVQQRLVPIGSGGEEPGLSPKGCGAVFEPLFADDGLKETLLAGGPAAALRRGALAVGFRPLRSRLDALVSEGRLTVTEAARAAA